MSDETARLGFFDFVAAIAEAWWALLFFPLVVGIATYYLTAPAPATYLARVDILLPVDAATRSTQLRLVDLGEGGVLTISALPDKTTSRISIAGPSSSQVSAALDEIQALADAGALADRATLDFLRSSLAMRQGRLQALDAAKEALEGGRAQMSVADYVQAMTAILGTQEAVQVKMDETSRATGLQPTGALLSAPEKPSPVVSSKRVAVPFAVIATVFLVVIVVVVAELFRAAGRRGSYLEQFTRIRRALKLPFSSR